MACEWLAWGPGGEHCIAWDELDLPVRAVSAISYGFPEVKTIADVAKLSKRELLRIPNCGRKSVREIEKQLARFGLALAPDYW